MPDRLKEKFKGIIKKDKLVLILLAGILLVIINIPVRKSSSADKKASQTEAYKSETLCTEDYVENLEKKLENILSETAGVGKTRVCITVGNGGKSVVHTQNKTSDSVVSETDSSGGIRRQEEKTKDENVIYTQENGQSTPFVEEELAPEIKGVVIIAQGAENASVKSDITEAASALLGIPVNKIKVLKMEV